jgi:hypothetical protein
LCACCRSRLPLAALNVATLQFLGDPDERGRPHLVWSKRMPHEIRWELYNLAEDRCETNDLAAQYPDRVQALAAEWEQWARRVNVIYAGGSTGDAAQD